jgi:hypothetical protein
MTAKVSQLPAQLDAECVAGDPFSLSVTSSGATITSPTVTLKNALGTTITGNVPTVTQVGAVTTVAFNAATTAALNTDLTRPVSVLWSLSALVNGAGPFQLVARRLTIYPVGTAGVSSTSSATLAVTVGGASISLNVAVAGASTMGATVTMSPPSGGDDSAVWSAKLDEANAAGLSLFVPSGVYQVNTQITKTYPIKMWCIPGSVQVNTTFASGHLFESIGSRGGNVLLTANADAGFTNESFTATISCASTASFAVGDYVLVADNSATTPAQPTRYSGMQTQVAEVVDATTLRLADPMYKPLTTANGAFVSKINSLSGVRISGFEFRHSVPTNTAGFIRTRYCSDIDIDFTGHRAGRAGVRLDHCYEYRVNTRAFNYYDVNFGSPGQFGYAVESNGACTHGDLTIYAKRVRHASAGSGITGEHGEVVNVRVTGQAHGCTSAAWDHHAQCYDILYDDCQSYGSNGGFVLRGPRQHISGGLSVNDINSVVAFEQAVDCSILGLTIRNAYRGIRVVNDQSVNAGSGLQVIGCRIQDTQRMAIKFEFAATGVLVKGNSFTNCGTSQEGTYQQTAIVSDVVLTRSQFEDNTIRDTQATKTTAAGFYFNATCVDTFTKGNTCHNGIPMRDLTAPGDASVRDIRFEADRLRFGEQSHPRSSADATATLADGVLHLAFFNAQDSNTLAKVWTRVKGTAGASNTLCRVGLYAVASDGLGTLVASTANDTSLFISANTDVTKSFSSPYVPQQGQRLAVGVLVIGGTMPSLVGSEVAGSATLTNASLGAARTPRVAGTLGGQTDLPASFTDASLAVTTTTMPYCALLTSAAS